MTFCYTATLLLTICICSLAQDPREILFGPLPLDRNSNKALIDIAQYINKDPKYHCSAIIQDIDEKIWSKTNCSLIIWGNNTILQQIKARYEASSRLSFFNMAKEEALDAVALLHEYLESKIINKLKESRLDMIICDSQSIPCLVTGSLLKIERTIIFSPICPPPWTSIFKRRPSYLPSIYTPLDNSMSFFQRSVNLFHDQINSMKDNAIIFLTGIELLKQGEITHILRLLRSRDELYIAQCIPGFNYPTYYPPNVINVGPIFSRLPQSIPQEVANFMAKFDHIVYFGVEAQTTCTDLKDIFNSFKELTKIGFLIISEDTDVPILKDSYPYNVLFLPNLYTNDVLAHPKISLCINDGTWSPVLESLYHGVPVLSLGSTFDRGANGRLLEYHEVGISMENECDINPKTFINNIFQLIDQVKFKKNANKFSRIMKADDANETIKNWLDHYFTFGIGELVHHGYLQKGSIRYDRLLWGLLPYLIIFLFVLSLYLAVSKILIITFFKVKKENRPK